MKRWHSDLPVFLKRIFYRAQSQNVFLEMVTAEPPLESPMPDVRRAPLLGFRVWTLHRMDLGTLYGYPVEERWLCEIGRAVPVYLRQELALGLLIVARRVEVAGNEQELSELAGVERAYLRGFAPAAS